MSRSSLPVILSVLLTVACHEPPRPGPASATRLDFPDVLDLHGLPAGPEDPPQGILADLGSWHGYALPPKDEPAHYGAFVGPYLLDHKQSRWASRYALRAEVLTDDGLLPLAEASRAEIRSFPGLLRQTFQLADLTLQMDLVFISSRSALVVASLSNPTLVPRVVTVRWSSGPLALARQEAEWPRRRSVFAWPETATAAADEAPGVLTAERLLLPARGQRRTAIAHTVALDDREPLDPLVAEALRDPERFLAENEARWDGYLTRLLSRDNGWLPATDSRHILVKGLQTLITNWRGPRGGLRHGGVVPSYAYAGFHGFWAWDSWKHAVALSRFAPQLAEDQVRAMYDYQQADGMVPDCVHVDPARNNYKNTKPPLSAWAVWELHRQQPDSGLLAEMFPRILAYHEWWYAHRDLDRNGLCEYGASEELRYAPSWESGMDHAVRFDGASLREGPAGDFGFDQESVDLNSFLFLEKKLLARMAREIGRGTTAQRLEGQAERLGRMVREGFYDPEAGYFFDRRLGTRELVTVYGPEGFAPLWTGLASAEQARAVAAVMRTRFDTRLPFPSVAADHPFFRPERYWRGPVWLDQAWFAIEGLRRYDEAGARERARVLVDNIEGLRQQAPLRENYNPLTGEGLDARHFSWSAAHLILLLTD